MRPARTIATCFWCAVIAGCGGSAEIGGGSAGGATATSLSFLMPVVAGEQAYNAYGIWPFGVHGGGHATDGHPGIDVEFTPGASVRAAAAGTIQAVVGDTEIPGRYTIQIAHGARYRTDYTNVATLAEGIAVGGAVAAGQSLGEAGTQTLTIGTTPVTFAMTHFQVDDFEHNEGLSNPFAVSPVDALDPSARALFDTIWQGAAYRQELCEPFYANDRGSVANPVLTRVWIRQTGAHAGRVVFTCRTSASTAAYVLQNESGVAIEEGAVTITPTAGTAFSTIDLTPTGGTVRRGVYVITGSTMTIDYAEPGAARPGDLSGGSTYTTS
jgi:hypothetical protein